MLVPLPSVVFDVPIARNPLLLTTGKCLEYVDIFMDNFALLGQGPKTHHVCKTLLHTIDHVFFILATGNSLFLHVHVSLKKRCRGDCSWDTSRLVLG